MSKRSDSIRFKVMPNGNIRAYQSGTDDKRGVGEMQITNPKNTGPTVITAHRTFVFIKYETE